MRYLLCCVGLVAISLGGCGSSYLAGADLVYQLRLQASGVPLAGRYIEPQVSVLGSEWRGAEAIPPADLAMLTKRDPVTILLRVSAADSGQRVAAAARVLDENNKLLAVGGAQLALNKDSTLPVLMVETKDNRNQALQLSLAVPAKVTAGRVTTLYGWGFSPSATVTFGGQTAPVVQWMSSVELVVTVPQGLPLGPVTVIVTNPGGVSDSRTDIGMIE